MRKIVDYCVEDAMGIDSEHMADGWVPWGPPVMVRMPVPGGEPEEKLVQAMVKWDDAQAPRAGKAKATLNDPCEFCGEINWNEGDTEDPRPWCNACGREKGAPS
jgi:hypothetical protein